MRLPQEIIVDLRDGREPAAEELRGFAAGVASGEVTEGQVAAFAMAVIFRGLSVEGRVALTEAMRDSGGTLDKLSAIPGYDAAPGVEALRRVVAEAGCAIIGQTAEIAPADRRFYAIRDVTGTVESVDLITASILSKKLAAGLDALVLDVKVGSGAFMADMERAEALARSLVAVANGAGRRTSALITDMDEPLASACGNAVEVANAVRFLTGEAADSRLWDVTVALGGEALALAGLAADEAEGRARVAAAFEDGRAAERFGRMVAALGGPPDFVERAAAHLPAAPVVLDVPPARDGFVSAVDGRALGNAVVALGGGRTRPEDGVDLAVGLEEVAGIGAMVDRDLPLARILARDRDSAEAAARRVRNAYMVSEAPSELGAAVRARLGPDAAA